MLWEAMKIEASKLRGIPLELFAMLAKPIMTELCAGREKTLAQEKCNISVISSEAGEVCIPVIPSDADEAPTLSFRAMLTKSASRGIPPIYSAWKPIV